MPWLLDAQEVTANLDGTFTKTTFPAKKPVRRAQVTQLGVTLDKMLAKLDDEDVQKRAEADAKYKEERDAALAVEDGATEEEIEVAERVVAQMEVDRESENVAMTIERLEREDKVVNTVLAELQRQVATQSKDRASLLERLSSHYHGLVDRAVGLTALGMGDEQVEKMALLSAQIEALRKKFDGQVHTTEEREAQISEMLRVQLDLEDQLKKAKANQAKAERGREKALKEAAAGRALKQENDDFRKLNDELGERVRQLKDEVEEMELEGRKFKKQWEMEQRVSADLQEQLNKEMQKAEAASRGGPTIRRPTRAVRRAAPAPAPPPEEATAAAAQAKKEKEEFEAVLAKERALREAQEAAGEEEKERMRAQLEALEEEKRKAAQRVEDAEAEAQAQAREAQARKEQAAAAQARADGQSQAGEEEGVRVMTKEEEALEDEMAELNKQMAQKAARVKGLMADENVADLGAGDVAGGYDDVAGAALAAALGDHVAADDAGEVSDDEPEAPESGAEDERKAAGKAKMAQMQLAKMQREMAETEKKLSKARANRERLAQEERELRSKLEGGRLAPEAAAEASARADELKRQAEAAAGKEAQLSHSLSTTTRHREEIMGASGAAEVGAALEAAMIAGAAEKQARVAAADASLNTLMEHETALRAQLQSMDEGETDETAEAALRDQLMDVEIQRAEMAKARDADAADLVMSQHEALEIGISLAGAAAEASEEAAQDGDGEAAELYAVRQYEVVVERLRAREQRHKAQLTRDRKKLASLGLAISKLQRAIEAEETETEEEASERSGRLAEAELERGTLQFHEAQWIAEVESSQRWITRLEDANRGTETAVDGAVAGGMGAGKATAILGQLRLHLNERVQMLGQGLLAVGQQSQQNRAAHAAAQASLRAASHASRPEFVRKLGAIDAQHASLGELHALLEEELEFCKAEMAEIHAKHDATLEAQIKAERAVRSSQDQEYEQQLQTLQQQQQKLEAG